MTKGILVTNGADISYASPLDFVMDSRLKGGLKIAKKLILNPPTDMQNNTTDFYYYGTYTHGLGYVPAVICFQDGFFGSGWQNEATIFRPSASADAQSVHFLCGNTTPFYVIIFGEKVSDS